MRCRHSEIHVTAGHENRPNSPATSTSVIKYRAQLKRKTKTAAKIYLTGCFMAVSSLERCGI